MCFLLDWFVLPMEKRSTINRKMPPSKLFSKITTPDGSVESLAIDNKHLASTSCTPNKRTPNKSGLTPIHPRKSPGTGMKNKSGLTPIHPGAHGRSKSPFFTKPLKSGLLPIRPSNVGLFFNILNYQINSKLFLKKINRLRRQFQILTTLHLFQDVEEGNLVLNPGNQVGENVFC